MKRVIVWFRNDLRLKDNPALSAAIKDADEIIPFYCFDERWFALSESGFAKTGAFRAQFLLESLADLKMAFEEFDIPLQIHHGSTLQALTDLQRRYPFNDIYAAEECTAEEIELELEIEAAGYRVLNGLLEVFLPSVLAHFNGQMSYQEKLYWRLIPQEYQTLINGENSFYNQVRVLLDFISGMTDRSPL